MTSSARRTFQLVAIALALSACGSGPRPGERPSFRVDGSEELTVVVRNQQLEDIRLWIWVEGRRERFGSVQGNDTQTLRWPLDFVARVRFEFDVTLGPHCFTPTVSLQPGDFVDLTIPPNLSMMQARCS